VIRWRDQINQILAAQRLRIAAPHQVSASNGLAKAQIVVSAGVRFFAGVPDDVSLPLVCSR
jgi:hypothetical protein